MTVRREKPVRSEWVRASSSGIHGRGLFARCAIPKDTRVIEYVGRRMTKSVALKLEERRLARIESGRGDPSIYAFVLNARTDIDGGVFWNTARLANHSCDPNCETQIIRGRIWIIAIRDIAKGDEITYDYNFDWVEWRDNRCRCGSEDCPGYIVRTDLRWRLRKRLAKGRKEAAALRGKRGEKSAA